MNKDFKNNRRHNPNYRQKNNSVSRNNVDYRARNNDFNNKLVSHLYRKLDISKYRYRILKYDNELPLLSQQNYYVAPNFAGKRVLVVFFKIMGRFMSYMIEKSTLTYNYEKLNLEKVMMSRLRIRLQPEAFYGTIFDAFYIFDKKEKCNVLMINDAYFINGKDLTNMTLKHKENYIKVFWESMVEDDSMDNVKVMYNKYSELKDVKKVYNEIIPNHELSYLVRGFAFVPEISGQKLIFLFGETDQLVQSQKVEKIKEKLKKDLEKDIETKLDENKYDIPDGVKLVGNFQLRKTDTVDVYHLYLPKVVKSNGVNKAIMTYFDVAYINGLDGSKFCKKLVKNTEKVLVMCEFNTHHQKWEPKKDITGQVKYPDRYKKIKKILYKFRV